MNLKKEAIKRIALSRNKAQSLKENQSKKANKHINWPAWLSALASIITTIFIFVQLRISDYQSDIFDIQTDILNQQTKLVEIQNQLFKESNIKVDSQNALFGRQNKLVEFQNEKTDAQNYLIDKQNTLLDFQNDRISQQTNLQEADRRSSIVYLFSNVLDKIDEELKTSNERKLSSELIARIASLTQALKPYKYLANDTITKRAISPEKGQLLSALINFKLHQNTYDSIFKKSNFQNTELQSSFLSSTIFNGIDLTNSIFINCNISNSIFRNSTLTNTIFNYSIFFNTHFIKSDLTDANMAVIKAEKAEFLECILQNVNFSGANLQESIFNSKQNHILEFGEILYGTLTNSSKNLKPINEVSSYKIIHGSESSYIHPVTQKNYYQVVITINNINVDTTSITDKNSNNNYFPDYYFKNLSFNNLNIDNMKNIDLSHSNLSGAKILNYQIIESSFTNSIITSIKFNNVSIWKTDFNNSKLDIQTFDNNFKFQISPIIAPISHYFNLKPRSKEIPNINFEVSGGIINSHNITKPYTHILEAKEKL
ncbi:pentapeptide repeat-containing protein [Maribacter sp. Hel_I_7]|uniref:pentapeptide repeat-containing protein n=1 Tax=Maribacter sp. Hel_I_7 TaxID=1249997 RepID=UPI00047A182D|nr:pentapeptide repeat-containing protein [Maribacter sp. Hel_I_7]